MPNNFQLSVALRNAQADQYDTVVDASGAATLVIFGGTQPANCAAADTTPVLATIPLGAAGTWLAAATGGTVAKTGAAWTDNADASGTATHFRIKGGATCHVQGTVGVSGCDMNVDSVTFTSGQVFTVTAFQVTIGNA